MNRKKYYSAALTYRFLADPLVFASNVCLSFFFLAALLMADVIPWEWVAVFAFALLFETQKSRWHRIYVRAVSFVASLFRIAWIVFCSAAVFMVIKDGSQGAIRGLMLMFFGMGLTANLFALPFEIWLALSKKAGERMYPA